MGSSYARVGELVVSGRISYIRERFNGLEELAGEGFLFLYFIIVALGAKS